MIDTEPAQYKQGPHFAGGCPRNSKPLNVGPHGEAAAGWLGHESIDTTQVYLHADLATKENALARTTPTGTPTGRYQPEDDTLLVFLQNL